MQSPGASERISKLGMRPSVSGEEFHWVDQLTKRRERGLKRDVFENVVKANVLCHTSSPLKLLIPRSSGVSAGPSVPPSVQITASGRRSLGVSA